MTHEEIIAFIDSGELEAYALQGREHANAERVETLITTVPQIEEAWMIVQQDLQFVSEKTKRPAPVAVLHNVMADIDVQSRQAAEMPAPAKRSLNWSRVAAAAAIVIIGSFAAWNMYKVGQLEQQLAEVNKRNTELAEAMQRFRASEEQLMAERALITDPNTQKLILSGLAKAPELKVVAYWNDSDQRAFLQPENLPALDNGQCFQMWADVEGEMVSVGVLAQSDAPVEVGFLANAESLNITIEKAGGSDHATVENLVASVVL
ncbi:anti-sigma factor [Sanyastnella coralliicola]|uniref:anti-sigma factor n=1 Tax=Sanyastnella coralliicola TaxID=3069118 RepID=UPI0027BA1E0C|nr:anti-sigma factor [Longitalea sp. SCSIO 12813]